MPQACLGQQTPVLAHSGEALRLTVYLKLATWLPWEYLIVAAVAVCCATYLLRARQYARLQSCVVRLVCVSVVLGTLRLLGNSARIYHMPWGLYNAVVQAAVLVVVLPILAWVSRHTAGQNVRGAGSRQGRREQRV